jgi:hypothetical protein
MTKCSQNIQKIFILEITFTNYRENIIKQENKHIVNIRSLYKEFGNFVITLIESVRNLHSDNLKLYWNLINELKESKSCDEISSAVDSSAWVSHFRNLSEIDDKFTERLNELKQKLSKLENSTNFNELDFPIKESEISRTLAKLKLNKSPGLDNISNKMLKNGQSILLPSFKKIFNACLSSGRYPKICADGYITTIHKVNDTADPNNYRGITLTSAVDKVFNSILNSRLHDCFMQK